MAYTVAMILSRFSPVIGGTELQCETLSRQLIARGYRVMVLTELHDKNLPRTEKRDGLEIYRLTAGGPPVVSAFIFGFRLWKWLRAHPEVQILHAHMLTGPTLAALVIGKLLNKPVLLKIAGAGATGDVGTSLLRSRGRVKLQVFRVLARYVVCPSFLTYQEIKKLGIEDHRIRRIPNGVRSDHYQPLSNPSQASLCAIFVGRWAQGKGVETLLEVWEKGASEPTFDWTLCLVLSQPLTPAQGDRIARLKEKVRVITEVRDPLPYYQTAALAVLLSENEGLSNFLLEAMACGLPTVTSPGAEIAPLEESKAWGWQTPARDAAALVTLLTQIGQDLPALQEKGRQGRQKVLHSFSSEAVANAYESFYGEILESF